MTHHRMNPVGLVSGNGMFLSAASILVAWIVLFADSAAFAMQSGDSSNSNDVEQWTSILYQSTLSSAEKSLRLHEVRDARKWLDHSPVYLRGWEWRFLDAQCDESMGSFPLGDAAVTSLDVSSDGTRMAVSTATGDVTIYELPGFSKASRIGDHHEAVYSVAFSEDGARLITVSRDMTSRVWDVVSGNEVSRVQLDNPGVAEPCFSPSGKEVATCSWMRMPDKTGPESVAGVVWIWDPDSGEVKFKKNIGVKPLDSMQWSSDGKKIVVGSWHGKVHVLDNEANELTTLTVPDEGVYTAVIAVAISPDGKLIAAGSKDRTARVWRLEDGILQATMTGHDGFVNAVKFTSGGQRLVTASVDGTIRTWQANSGKPLEVLHGHTGNVTAIDLTNDDQLLVSAGRDQQLRSWDLSASYGGRLAVRVEPEGTYSTTFSPDGSRLYVACYDGHVRVLNSASGQIVDDWLAHESSCNTLALSSDGSRLLTCSRDKTAKLWNTADRSLLKKLDGGAGVTHCALSPDGKLAALGVENKFQVWDVESGKQICVGEGHKENLIDLVFSPDGAKIASSAHSDAARIWNSRSGELVAMLGDRPASTVLFSHNGKWVATSEGGNVCIWDVAKFELRHSIPLGSSTASRLSFSPDDSRLAAGADAVHILDPGAGIPLLRFQPNDDTIYYLSFSPDGTKLASCTTGGSIAISGISPEIETPQSTDNADWSIEAASIVYSGRRGDTQNLYRLDLASGKTSKLTDNQAKGRGANNPRLSPDHKQLAFQFTQPGNYDIHVMPASGGGSQPLVTDAAYDVSPIWSPDGDQIAFMSTRGFELGSIGPFPGHIYVVDADGKNLRQVTRQPLTSSLGPSDWSPDGKTLLMARIKNDQTDIYTLDVATGSEQALIHSEKSESSGVVSHDGKRIAYYVESDNGSNIVVCRTDGSMPVMLTSTGFNYYPRWSPDDQWIIFTSIGEGEQCDISAVRLKDKKVITLVATPEDEREGVWIR